jgi:hypothetical protein
MTIRLVLVGSVLSLLSLSSVRGQDASPAYLRFANRRDHVELEKTRGMLDLQKPFTIELWVRWGTNITDKHLYLAGDEAWPGMSDKVPVTAESGWVLRTKKAKGADKQPLDFTVAATVKGKRTWLSVLTDSQQVEPKQWQHIAICRTASELQIFWNGVPVARQALAGIELHSAPSNIFLGVREHAWKDREFVGDIRAFRISSKARYGAKFTPAVPTEKDAGTLVLLDIPAAEAQVPDLSGEEHHGALVGVELIKPGK